MNGNDSPYAGIRVLDFGHAVMGPTAGLALADLGAEVIRVEPVGGDPTRRLKGFGTGYFAFYNRNKKSVALDLKAPRGLALAKRLIATADVLIENFAPGTMKRLGLGYEEVSEDFPRLIYLSLKGFLPGPYEGRAALDEVAQMMSGLAFMTGPPGRPLRAGASIVDVTGGIMGALGVLAALAQRRRTGKGQLVASGLFESAAFLMGQHMACAALSGRPVPPMPARVSAWAIYDQFDTADGKRVFLGISSDRQWERFCEAFGQPGLAADPALRTNNLRIEARGRLLPEIARIVGGLALARLSELAIEAKLPFAPVARPEDLFDDPHLKAGGRLLPTRLPGGARAALPALPIEMDGKAPRKRADPPAAGADSRDILHELGLGGEEIDSLAADGVIGEAGEHG